MLRFSALLLLMPSVAYADAVQERVEALQEVPEPPAMPDGPDRIEHLSQGERAPYEGMLLDTDTAIRWTNALRWWPETFRLRLQLMGAVFAEVDLSHQTRMRIVEESYQREIEGLREDLRQMSQRLADSLSRQWYETVEFGVALGVGLTVLIGGLAAGLALGLGG